VLPSKGQVENQVKISRGRFFAPRLRVTDYDELNDILNESCLDYAKSMRHPEFKDRTVCEVFLEEQASLVPCQGPYNGFHETTVAVSKTCLVSFDRNRYSVSVAAAGRPVQLRATATGITLLQNGKIVGEHVRAFGRDRTIYDPWHYVPVLERKPGALRNGAPFKELMLPPAMETIRKRLGAVPDGDRQMVDLLLAAHAQGIDAVEAACTAALDTGLRSADAILNILSRQNDPDDLPDLVPIPPHLQLREDPIADCARYDRIVLEAGHGAS